MVTASLTEGGKVYELRYTPNVSPGCVSAIRRNCKYILPGPVSDENLYDPCAKLTHFQGAWLAVRYRYQACSEQNQAFKVFFADAMANDLYREWSVGEEYNYRWSIRIYLSSPTHCLCFFESLGFCLYFLGAMIDTNKKNFPDVASPKRITLKATCTAFKEVFLCFYKLPSPGIVERL